MALTISSRISLPPPTSEPRCSRRMRCARARKFNAAGLSVTSTKSAARRAPPTDGRAWGMGRTDGLRGPARVLSPASSHYAGGLEGIRPMCSQLQAWVEVLLGEVEAGRLPREDAYPTLKEEICAGRHLPRTLTPPRGTYWLAFCGRERLLSGSNLPLHLVGDDLPEMRGGGEVVWFEFGAAEGRVGEQEDGRHHPGGERLLCARPWDSAEYALHIDAYDGEILLARTKTHGMVFRRATAASRARPPISGPRRGLGWP